MIWKDEVIENMTAYGSPVFYIPLIIIMLFYNLKLAKALIIAILLIEISCGLIKLAFPTIRPTPRKRDSFIQKWDAGSFPSVHTSRAAAMALIISIFYPVKVIIFLSVFIFLCVAYSRVYLKHHYFIDVLGGSVLGSLLAYISLLIVG